MVCDTGWGLEVFKESTMIVKKIWISRKNLERHNKRPVEMYGWFLFGIIPLYVVERVTR